MISTIHKTIFIDQHKDPLSIVSKTTTKCSECTMEDCYALICLPILKVNLDGKVFPTQNSRLPNHRKCCDSLEIKDDKIHLIEFKVKNFNHYNTEESINEYKSQFNDTVENIKSKCNIQFENDFIENYLIIHFSKNFNAVKYYEDIKYFSEKHKINLLNRNDYIEDYCH